MLRQNEIGKTFYVYMYTSPSGKHYVGRTCNSQTVRAGSNGDNYKGCTVFWRAIQKYGWENFKYEVLEDDIPSNEIDKRECYWISYYHSSANENGYNLIIPDDELDKTYSLETLQKMSESHLGHEPWNKGKKNVYSKESLEQMSESHKKGNCGLTKKQKAEKARIKRASEVKHNLTKEEIRQRARERFFGEYNPNEKLGYQVMPVSQFDLNGNYIKTFKSTVMASESTGIPKYEIRRCCRGEKSITGEFQWCDVGKESTIGIYKNTPKKNKRNIPIVQMKDNKIINIFPSITIAAKNMCVDKSSIGGCVRGRYKTSCGFQWFRLSEINQQLLDEYYSRTS